LDFYGFAFAIWKGKRHIWRVSANKKPGSRFGGLLQRHLAALSYVGGVLLPLILRTWRRPVIFSRWTGMGDIICTVPAALELMKRHPGATFIYNCHPDFTTIPRLTRVADRITSLEAMGIVGHWYRFLLGGFYHFAHGDDISGRVAKEPMIAEFCRQFGVAVTDTHPTLQASPAAGDKARRILREKGLDAASLILIHPGPSWPVKEWPRDRWIDLIKELQAQGFTSIGQLGVGRYTNFGRVEVESFPGVVSLVDVLSIEECVAVIAQAKLFIGIDSGLLHIAASTRTPAVGLWGSTMPQFFYAEKIRNSFAVSKVECAGCYHRLPRLHWITGCPYDIKCMKELDPDEVLRLCFSRMEYKRS
jgi:ADP-heptose:LPS heptosyltransferase